ncbi:unnamed protein product [Rotaria magnacalcarata]|uniref:Uncharacterized protein n=3 Tax=Rotaria magnacalcarata TaxID=392030 RepID=A0A816D3B2_9BILA|nr:unnamed protein product [Rotaria magnacalcarata]CAF4116889.1 unnamed protein product [Rotaria magnacalcarata]
MSIDSQQASINNPPENLNERKSEHNSPEASSELKTNNNSPETPNEQQAEIKPSESPSERKAENNSPETPNEQQAEIKPSEPPSERKAENNSPETPNEQQAEIKPSESPNERKAENNSSETPNEQQTEIKPSESPSERKAENNSPETPNEQQTEKRSSEPAVERISSEKSSKQAKENNTPETLNEQKDEQQLSSDRDETNNREGSQRIIRFTSQLSKSSDQIQPTKVTNTIAHERPISPVTRHRVIKPLMSPQRTRSNSPRKTFSYLPPDRLNLRKWKEQRRHIAKKEEDDRIYYENRRKLERLARIAKEPSTYPAMHIEQEHLRDRHALDYHRKVLKSYIPIMRENLCLVNRLATVKGVYDTKKMEEEYARHTMILKQDAANRKKPRKTTTQRPFILPKINTKS